MVLQLDKAVLAGQYLGLGIQQINSRPSCTCTGDRRQMWQHGYPSMFSNSGGSTHALHNALAGQEILAEVQMPMRQLSHDVFFSSFHVAFALTTPLSSACSPHIVHA
ncbi:hypothetical protein E1B28_013248 [Marasmius oreades]|uniref:Uncharacterized protein n=1 Tax=Marasmius oreades TaxID=181124 RepID=A0A9P7RP71_9AGAR|nr:uncharacterized protein E1B28_013248 [Marasmius oreades]KAG7087269.1 hypothetical protein E1B28_013248 [Marasmius oreades]